MATRTMIFIFLFVLKPWLTFIREHGTSERILDALGGGEIITDIKTCYQPQHPKKFHRIMNL